MLLTVKGSVLFVRLWHNNRCIKYVVINEDDYA